MNFNELIKFILNTNNDKEKYIEEINECIVEYKKTNNYEELEKLLKIINLDDLDDEKEKLLLMKIDSKTLFEHVIEKECYIPLELKDFICTKEKLIKIYLKYKKNELFQFQKEKVFLQKIDNKLLLEHLLELNLLTPEIIYKIEKRELVDVLLKHNKLELLKHANEEIMFVKIDDKLVIEYLFEKRLVTPQLISKIVNKDIVNYILIYKENELLKYINTALLDKKIGKKYILDILLDKNINIEMQTIYSIELVNLLIERNRYDLLSKTCSYLLKEKVKKENKTLFEVLLEKNIIPEEGVQSTKYLIGEYKLFYNLLLKYNKLELLADAQESSLLCKYGTNQTLLETLLIKGIKPQYYYFHEKETYRLFLKYNMNDELENCKDEEILLMKIDDNNLLIDEILKRNLKLKLVTIESEIIINKIYQYKRKDLYKNFSSTLLLKKNEFNQTYLETLLDSFEKNDVNISIIINDATPPYEISQCYAIYASRDLQMYLPELKKEELLKKYNGVSILDELIKKYPQYINKIISKKVRRDLDIAMILKLNNIEQPDIEFESFVSKLEQNYLNKTIKEYESLQISQGEEEKLNELDKIMRDGREDKYLINALIASYRHLFHIKSPYAYEINHLITAKINNPQFTYCKVAEGAFFTPGKKTISMDDTNIDTLNHETSHALFYFQTNKEIPQELREEINYLYNDQDFLNKTYEYSLKFKELKRNVEEEVEKIFMPKYDASLTEEKIEEIQGYLDELNVIERHKYLKQGYSEETLELICKRTFTIEEYIEQDRKIIKENMVDLILRTEFGYFITIGDILDGIYKGKFKSGVLKTKEGIQIQPAYGHGIDYYNRGINTIFDEMIANYGELVKSKKSELGLIYLKEYIGENLFNIIKNYYDEEILKNPNYINEIGGNYGR